MGKYKQIILIIISPIIGIPLLFFAFIFSILLLFLLLRIIILPSGDKLERIYHDNQAIFQELGEYFDRGEVPEDLEYYDNHIGSSAIYITPIRTYSNIKGGIGMAHISYSFDSGEGSGYIYAPAGIISGKLLDNIDDAPRHCDNNFVCNYYQELGDGWYIHYENINYP